jgi:hypothetical protein
VSEEKGKTLFREMGYSTGEFCGVLPAAMRDWPITGGPDAWQVSTAGGDVIATIRIQPMPERAMGSLRLPVLAVTIDLEAASPDQASEFLRRFERGFHRGGG